MYAAGATSIWFALKGITPVNDSRLIASASSTDNDPIYSIVADSADDTKASIFIRDDAATLVLNGNTTPAATGAFDNTNRVVGMTDNGSTVSFYIDAGSAITQAYSRAGLTFTMDRLGLGGLVRGSTNLWWAGNVFGLVVVNRVINSTERGNLVTWLGTKAGLTL